jgi:hypothetical protein
VKQALDGLPITLDDTYTRVLLDIEAMYHDHALTLLRWLAYARSPPTLSELVEAAVTDPIQESSIDAANRGDLEDTLNILSGLVTIEESKDTDVEGHSETKSSTPDTSTIDHAQTGVASYSRDLAPDTRVRLAHFSVKEYLESNRVLKSGADQFYLESATGHRVLAQSCLTYLRYYSVSSERTSKEADLQTFPLLRYAAESWFHHSALQHSGGACREGPFLRLDNARQQWLLVHDPDPSWADIFPGFTHDAGSAIYYASLLGLLAAVCSLLKSGAEVNARGGFYGSALQAASLNGHTEVVRLLLHNSADVHAQGGELGNALQAASSEGHTEVMQLLLDQGADVNDQGGRNVNALQAASSNGHKEMVQLLLDNNASINVQCGDHGSAL